MHETNAVNFICDKRKTKIKFFELSSSIFSTYWFMLREQRAHWIGKLIKQWNPDHLSMQPNLMISFLPLCLE